MGKQVVEPAVREIPVQLHIKILAWQGLRNRSGQTLMTMHAHEP